MSTVVTGKNGAQPIEPNQYARETVESIIVAFILAFLFRAFVAEAFVIPTGSMAPTLMGAHKDLIDPESGVRYQVGASGEYNSETGVPNGNAVVGSTAAVSRALQTIDDSEPTYSGDRILVSKFDYVLSSPQRWDVLVFKFPGNARMNYIKRLIGLPEEKLLIREGDVYVRKNDADPWTIARKPAHKALAMRQPVSDTDHLAKSLVQLGFPSSWQAWSENGQPNSWNVAQSVDAGWSAKLTASTEPNWLRYYHKELSEKQWLDVIENQRLPEVAADDSSLVTDYLAYNSYYQADHYFNATPQDLVQDFSRRDIREFHSSDNGMHWVGDLTGEFELEIESDSGQVLLQLYEFGIAFELTIDVKTGEASLHAIDKVAPGNGEIEGFFNGQSDVVAATKIRGPGKYHVAMGNVDDQIYLWINHRLVKFNQPAEFDTWQVRGEGQRRPFWSETQPLDAAPIALGGQNIAMKVSRAQVFRDLYYIAIRGGNSYEFAGDLMASAPKDGSVVRWADDEIVRYVYSHPADWDKTPLFASRQTQQFELGPGQYFPMGDNSAQSLDARMWRENFVDQKFLLGKALIVFWPHPWTTPVPFFPNFARMGLIR